MYDTPSSYLFSLGQAIAGGELFLYCMAVVGTIVWVANKPWLADEAAGDSRLFPPKLWFNLFSVMAFGTCTMFFGIELVKLKMRPEIISLSAVIYGVSIVVWYVIIVLSAAIPPNYEQTLSTGAKSLQSDLRKLRSDDGT
jgi:hypothetical protein